MARNMINVLNMFVDLGNSITKYGVLGKDEIHCFDSKTTKVESIWDKHDKVVEYIDKNGEEVRFLVGTGEYEIQNRKAMKENTLPLLKTAIGELIGSETMVSTNISLGLPIAQYQKYKERFREEIQSLKVLEYNYNGIPRRVVIENVFIFPEGLGAFIALQKEKGILIDIGSKTTDIFLFNKELMKPMSIYKGVLDIYNSIAQNLSDQFECNFSVEEIDDILENGYFDYGQEQDISKCLEEAKGIVKEIYNKLTLNYEVNKYPVILVGGGAKFLGEKIKAKIPNLEIHEDIFLNAKGYGILMNNRLNNM